MKNEEEIFGTDVRYLKKAIHTLHHETLPGIMMDSRGALELLGGIKKLLDGTLSSCQEIFMCEPISEMNRTRRKTNPKYSTENLLKESSARCKIKSTVTGNEDLTRGMQKSKESLLTFHRKTLPEIVANWEKAMELTAQLINSGRTVLASYRKMLSCHLGNGNLKSKLTISSFSKWSGGSVVHKDVYNTRENNETEISQVEFSPMTSVRIDDPEKSYETNSLSGKEEGISLEARYSDSAKKTSNPTKINYSHEENLNMIKCIQENNGYCIAGSIQFWDNMKNLGKFSTSRSPISLALHWTRYVNKSLDLLVPNELERQEFGKAFERAQNENINRKKSPQKRRTYRCKDCNYKSSRYTNITRHEKRMHRKTVQRSCCGLVMRTKYDWYIHYKIAHSGKGTKSADWKEKHQMLANQLPSGPKSPNLQNRRKKLNYNSHETLRSSIGMSKRLLHAALRKEMRVKSLNLVKLEDVPLIYLMKDPELRKELQPSVIDTEKVESSHAATPDNENTRITESPHSPPQGSSSTGSDINSGDTKLQSQASCSEQLLHSRAKTSEESSPILLEKISYANDCNAQEYSNEVFQSNFNHNSGLNFPNFNEFIYFDLSNTPIHLDWMEDAIIV